MKWSEFEEKFLVACYIVTDETSGDIINTRDVFARFDIPFKRGWVHRTIDGFIRNGYAKDTRSIGGDEAAQDVWLTAEGYRAAERVEDNVLLVEKDNGISPDNTSHAVTSTEPVMSFTPDQSALSAKIDSTDWTGLAKRISSHDAIIIKDKSRELQKAILQSDADVQTKADACKRVEAVLVLLEAPNVPWREVVHLLNHPTVTALLVGLNLIQFIIGLAAS